MELRFWIAIVFSFASLGFLFFVALFFILLPILRGAPFVPTRKERIEKALKLAGIKPGQKIVDLGSGDGRILLAAAKKGAKARGFDINPLLVWATKRAIKKQGLRDLAVCQWKNFWWQDLSCFDIVFVYGLSHIMKGLGKKLQRELKPGAKVVSLIFQFPNWQPVLGDKDGIYIYTIPPALPKPKK